MTLRDQTAWTSVVFSLGANLGDPASTLTAAVAELDACEGIVVQATSPMYRTAPVGLIDQPDFVNLVAVGITTLPPEDLWAAVSAVEQRHGRVRTIRGGPRTLDVDVITLGQRREHGDALVLPHPRAHERAFVLVPWLAVDPDAELPGRGPVAALVASMDVSGVERLAEQHREARRGSAHASHGR